VNNKNDDKYIVVEMIVTINAKEYIASNIKSFNSLLQAHSDITINKNSLRWKSMQFEYNIQHGNVDSENNFFDVELKIDKKDNQVTFDEFTSLVREIKKIVGRFTTTPPQMIWDDISKYYASEAYPLIHNIENILRKLITKFMLVNIGISWIKQTLPEDFKASRGSKNTNKQTSNNILYDTDFIQLSDFLFAAYRDIDVSELVKRLENINPNEFTADAVDGIKKFIPRSNWDKYLKDHVECEGSFLQKRWTELYELRCKIAHNNTFTKNEFERVKNIIDDLYPPLISAISKLSKIKITEEEKQEIVDELDKQEIVKEFDKQESTSHDQVLVKKFISQSNRLGSRLNRLSRILRDLPEGTKIIERVKDLYLSNILTDEFYHEFKSINEARTNSKRLTIYDNFQLDELLNISKNLNNQLNDVLDSLGLDV